MQSLIGSTRVAQITGTSANLAQRFGLCGLLGPAQETARGLLYDQRIVTDLMQRPLVDESMIGPTLIVRLREATLTGEDWRVYTGWSTAGPDEHRANAARGDWIMSLDQPSHYALVAVVGPFVVGWWQITGLDPAAPSASRRSRYLVTPDPTALDPLFKDRRWDLSDGWVVGRRGI